MKFVFILHKHNHVGDATYVQLKNVIVHFKECAASSQLKRSIQWEWVYVNAIPLRPQIIRELNILNEFQVSLSSSNFIYMKAMMNRTEF